MAQLGARFHGMEEVVGSNPTRSTNLKSFAINVRTLQRSLTLWRMREGNSSRLSRPSELQVPLPLLPRSLPCH